MSKETLRLGKGYQDMMDYINAKYQDEFAFVEARRGQIGSKDHTIFVASKKYPDRYVTVFCRETADGVQYGDNYPEIKFEMKTKELIEGIVNSVNSDSCVVYQPSAFSFHESLTDEATFADYIQNTTSIYFTAFVKTGKEPVDRDRFLPAFGKALADSGICCSGHIYFIDLEDLSTIDEDNYSEYIHSDACQVMLAFSMTQAGIIDSYRWAEL